jgi:hypothetical protein
MFFVNPGDSMTKQYEHRLGETMDIGGINLKVERAGDKFRFTFYDRELGPVSVTVDKDDAININNPYLTHQLIIESVGQWIMKYRLEELWIRGNQ